MTHDYFQKLVLRTRGRLPLVVSKLETMLAPARGNAGDAPELAKGAVPAAPQNGTPEHDEPTAPPSPRQLLASARARAGLTLSNYLERRRR